MSRTDAEYKQLSINEFTKAAGRYESDKAGIYETCKQNYPEIIEMLKDRPFTELLDAGCGPGPLTGLLSQMYPDRHFTGIDLTPAMIEKAREKHLPNAEFVVGDCEDLPFPDGVFDVIVCCESFHHYPNPQNFFDSVHRCLKKGGILILRDYAAGGILAWSMNHLMMPLLNAVGHGDVKVSSEAELKAMCKRAHLTVESFKPIKGARHKMTLVAKK